MLAVRLGSMIALASICAAQNSTSLSTSSPSTFISFTSAPASSSAFNTTLSNQAPTAISTRTANRTVTITLARNGSAEHCQAQLEAWESSSLDWVATPISTYTSTVTDDYTSTILSETNYECTMTCGTICYAGPVSTTLSTTHIVSTYVNTYTDFARYPTPKPNCTIADNDCLSMKSTWSKISSEIFSGTQTGAPTLTLPDPPKCNACSSSACTFQRGGVDLYFWPVTTSVSRDYCAFEPTSSFVTDLTQDVNNTFVPTTTGPYTIVDGITMYQGNVYLSIHEPFVVDNCGNEITRASPGHNVVTIASSDLYSLRKYPGNLSPYPVNYDDFNTPVPFSAYYGQSTCWRPACSVVFQDSYRPFMLMPPQIRNLDSNWASCEFDKYGLFDPPIALKSVGDMFSSAAPEPTAASPADPVTTPATPGQSGRNDHPGPTAVPDPETTANPEPPIDPQPSSDPEPTLDPQPTTDPNPTQSASDPSASDPSASDPPPNDPPTNDPSTNNPPANTVPANDPPASTDPSPNNPPANDDPSTNNPPANNDPSPGIPPSNNDPALSAPNNNDPTTGIPNSTAGQDPSSNPNPSPTSPPANDPANPSVNNPTNAPANNPTNPPNNNPPAPVVTIGPSTLSVDPSGGGLIINPSSTISPGDPPVTVGDQTVSVGPSGIVIIGPSGTSIVLTVAPTALTTPITQEITVDSDTFTLINSNFVVGPGTTIGPEDPAVTVDGTTFSVGTTGVVILSSGGGTTIVPTASITTTGATEEFTGAAQKVMKRRKVWSFAGLIGAAAMLW